MGDGFLGAIYLANVSAWLMPAVPLACSLLCSRKVSRQPGNVSLVSEEPLPRLSSSLVTHTSQRGGVEREALDGQR